MALVTIGVPVYNGAKLIGECLDCLTQQTLRDIEIVVSDNASTDDTGAIVSRYASSDSRIRYIRQPKNIGLMNNYSAVVDTAQSPYFILRCHDDLSSLNYVEALLNGLRGHKTAELAVSNIETLRAGKPRRAHGLPRIMYPLAVMNVCELLFRSHAAWFCGLWDLAAMRPVFDRVWARYDSPWGPDHLTLYPFLIAQKVAFVPDAVFIQRITRKEGDAAYTKPDLPRMVALRRTFGETCREFRREQDIAGASEAVMAAMTWAYTGKRVYRARDIIWHSLLNRSGHLR